MEPGKDKDGTTEKRSSFSGKQSKSSKLAQLMESQGLVVGKTLGSGSYATVKSAYDLNRKRKVALKIITKKKSLDDYFTKFLPREIEAMRNLGNHPCLVSFFQIIETTDRYVFVMELAENGDVLTVIKNKKFIKEKQARTWFIQLHDGIEHMHKLGLAHRDIKSENLLLDSKRNLKITDFGFVKMIGKSKSGKNQLSSTYCGSYAYASPEILRGKPYDAFMSEVWSMGVVLFTMVFGRLPFDDSDHATLMKQTQNKVVFPPKPNVSQDCRALLNKILVKVGERLPLSHIPKQPWVKAAMVESDTGEASSASLLADTLSVGKGNKEGDPVSTATVTGPDKDSGKPSQATVRESQGEASTSQKAQTTPTTMDTAKAAKMFRLI